MEDWFALVQSVFIGLIFSYLLAKLISIVISFKDENLRIVHEATEQKLSGIDEGNEPKLAADDSGASNLKTYGASGKEMAVVEKGSEGCENIVGEVGHEDEEDGDDDWEGIESTELDETFSAATAFVAASAADRLSQKVSNDIQLQLYGLYKIATEGPCSAPQPSALKITARAKWQAWKKLGAMPPEEAMQRYIDIVMELYPTWASGSSVKSKDGDLDVKGKDARGPMGPVFSTFEYEEESGNESKMDAIHAFAREGEIDNLLKCLESGTSVDTKDSEGRTPLHWAVDRGHLNVTELLVTRNADINAKDNDGQTPLHYAAVCERKDIAEFLVKQKADVDVKDNEGDTPCDLCESNWPWMRSAAKTME
ncbi:Acyl-CoA-binding protein, ACBP [Dillenia turbinata]|uniref:Acyl-CoA-binding protein, ACBP n=1 Tax=Dillenia turbinata TaxID=194707 RepID=A0AAN8W034_9MAGN